MSILDSANAALELQVEASWIAAPDQGFEIRELSFAIADEIEHAFKIAARRSLAALSLCRRLALPRNHGKVT